MDQAMKIILALVALCLLSACAAQDRVASSNPSNVVIVRDTTVAAAVSLAAQECGRYGKNPRLASQQGFIMSFDCVTP